MAERLNAEQLRGMAEQAREEQVRIEGGLDGYYTHFDIGGEFLQQLDTKHLRWVRSVFLEVAGIVSNQDLVVQRVARQQDRVKRYSRFGALICDVEETKLHAYKIATGEYRDPAWTTPSGWPIEFQVPGRPRIDWMGAGGRF